MDNFSQHNIKVLRKRTGLTQEKFSSMLGVSRAALGSYEEARALVPVDILSKLSTMFAMSIDQLVKEKLA